VKRAVEMMDDEPLYHALAWRTVVWEAHRGLIAHSRLLDY